MEHGGFTERLYGARKRTLSDQSDSSDTTKPPACPLCAKPMRLCTARQGARAGSQFWGCSGYPDCEGTRPADN